MALSKTEKTSVAVLIIAVLGVVGYFVFSGSSSPSVTPAVAGSAPVGQDILALVQKLKVVSIDPTIFSSAVFSSLKDFQVPLASEVQGRADPLSPLGVDAPFITTLAAPVQNISQDNSQVLEPSATSSVTVSTSSPAM